MEPMLLPDWTEKKPGVEVHGGRWPLGLESLGQRVVARHLLPGVTNGTWRVRYYAFFTWLFWAEHRKLLAEGVGTVRESDQDHWRMRLENALRATTIMANQTAGLIGINNAIPVPENRRGRFPLVERDVTTAWTPAAYQASVLALGGVAMENKIAVVRGHLAIELARAFDEGLRRASGRSGVLERLLSDEETISVADLERIQPALALRRLDGDDPERDILVEMLFRLDPDRDPTRGLLLKGDWRRSRSLTLLLEAVRQGGAAFSSKKGAPHHLFAYGALPDGRPFVVPPVLAETFSYWRRYQERQHEKIGIYAIWREVVGVIDAAERAGRPLPGEQVVAQVVRRASESGMLRDWLGEDALDLSVAAATEALLLRIEDAGLDPDGAAYGLASVLIDRGFVDYAGSGLILLLLQAANWRRAVPAVESGVARVHEQVSPGEITLGELTRTLERHRDRTLAEFLAWCTEHWALAQSLRVALEKWTRDDYRYFIARDEDGYRIVQPQEPKANLVFDPPRVESSLALLYDLGLLEGSDEGGYIITPAGLGVLEDALVFHEVAADELAT
jgi:hypothetical protein